MSNKKTVVLIVSVLVMIFFVILGMRFFSGEDSWICVDGRWVKHGFPSGDKPDRECRNKTSEDAIHVNKSEKDELDMENKSAEKLNNGGEANIIVDLPKANETIGLPVVIRGKARVFENTFNYRIKKSNGNVIMESYAIANSPDIGQFGPFEILANYPDPGDDEGSIEVFEYSAKDGSEINKVETKIFFKKVDSADVKIFFGNRKEDPDGENCSRVYEVSRRIPKTSGVAKAAISELIFGTYLEEEDNGYFSEINRDVKMNKITIAGGIARVDFSKELADSIGGSCEKEIVKAQINETLKQFPTVKEVEITVDGRKDIL